MYYELKFQPYNNKDNKIKHLYGLKFETANNVGREG